MPALEYAGEPQLKDELKRLHECLTHFVHDGPESRRQQRYPVVTRVQVLPLSEDLRVVGFPMNAVTLNVSAGGLALLHTQPLDQPYLAVDFSGVGDTLPPVILKKLRVTQVGASYQCSGEFLSRVNR